jgi:hypothetical protein
MEANEQKTDQHNRVGENVDITDQEKGTIIVENLLQENGPEDVEHDLIDEVIENNDEADFPNIENNVDRNVGEVLFYVQAAVLIIVVLACIINLSLVNGDQSSWTALLSASLGILVPQPTISLNLKKKKSKK